MKKLLRPMTPRLFMWDKTRFSFNEGGRILTISISWSGVYGFRIYVLGLALSLTYYPWRWE